MSLQNYSGSVSNPLALPGQVQQASNYPDQQHYHSLPQQGDMNFSRTNYNQQFNPQQQEQTEQALHQLHGQNQQLLAELERHQQMAAKQNQALEEQGGILSKLKNVFSPQKNDQVQDSLARVKAEYEGKLDSVLSAEIEARSQGQSMPITTQVGNDLYTSLIKQSELNHALTHEISQLKQQLQRVGDPNLQLDRDCYNRMDSHLIKRMEQMFGPYGTNEDEKAIMREAVTKRMQGVLTKLQQQKPQEWAEIRRDWRKQERLVDWNVEKILPPAVRDNMKVAQLKESPMSREELMQAWNEANQLPEGPEKNRWKSEIRGQLLQMGAFGKKPNKNLGHVFGAQ